MKSKWLYYAILGALMLPITACDESCNGLWDPSTTGDPGGGGGTIGAPTGTQCTVTSSQETTQSDAVHCGYNDLGVANMGIYRQDQLSCTTYDDNGNPTGTTQQTQSTFERCYEP